MLNRIVKGVVFLLLIVILTSCSTDTDKDIVSNENTQDENIIKEGNNKEKDKTVVIMNEFESLVLQRTSPKKILEFIDVNISKVGKEQGTRMIEGFEEVQKEYKNKYEEIILNSSRNINLYDIFGYQFDRAKVKEIKDESIRDIFNGGFKLATNEGMYYLIIDYGYLTKYSQHLTDEMKDYIKIMALESDKPASNDAGLVITWDELGRRCINTEKYTDNYLNSPRREVVSDRYYYYLRMYFTGLDNTPIYDWNTKNLSNEVKDSYEKIISENQDSLTAEILKEYLDYLRENDWKITERSYTFANNLISKRLGR